MIKALFIYSHVDNRSPVKTTAGLTSLVLLNKGVVLSHGGITQNLKGRVLER